MLKVQEVGLLWRSATKVGSLVILAHHCDVTNTHVNCQIPSHIRTRLKMFINKGSILGFFALQGWVHMTTLQPVRHRFTSSCGILCKASFNLKTFPNKQHPNVAVTCNLWGFDVCLPYLSPQLPWPIIFTNRRLSDHEDLPRRRRNLRLSQDETPGQRAWGCSIHKMCHEDPPAPFSFKRRASVHSRRRPSSAAAAPAQLLLRPPTATVTTNLQDQRSATNPPRLRVESAEFLAGKMRWWLKAPPFKIFALLRMGIFLSTQSIYQFTTRKLASDLRMLLDAHLRNMSSVFAPQKTGEAFLVTLGVLFLD